MEFKVGDVVKCVEFEGSGKRLMKDVEYEIVDVIVEERDKYVQVYVKGTQKYDDVNNLIRGRNFFVRRFQHVKEKKEMEAAKMDRLGRWRDAKGHFIKKPVVINPPVEPKKEPEEHPESVRAALNESVAVKGVGTCSYGFQLKDGSLFLHAADVCHARFNANGLHENPITHAALHISGHIKVAENPAVYKEFAQWFITKSPFSKYILTKDWDEAENLGILLDLSFTVSQLATTAVALRSGSEYSGNLGLWKRLVSDGVDGYVAWILSTFFKGTAKGNYLFNNFMGGHHVLSAGMSIKKVLLCAKEGLRPVNLEPMKLNRGHYALFKSIGDFDPYQAGKVGDEKISCVFTRDLPKVKEKSWDNPVGVAEAPYLSVIGVAIRLQELMK